MNSTVDSSGKSTFEQSSDYQDIVTDTVKCLKSDIEEKNFSVMELEEIKRLEQKKKDRKTAVQFINKKIEEKVKNNVGTETRSKNSDSIEKEMEGMERSLEKELQKIEDKLEESESVENQSERGSINIGVLKIQVYEGDPVLLLDRGDKVIELKHYHLIDLIRGEVSEDLSEGSLNDEAQNGRPKNNQEVNSNNSEDRGKESKDKGREEVNQNSDRNLNKDKTISKGSRYEKEKKIGEKPTEIEKLRRKLKKEYNLEEKDLKGKTIEELRELEEKVANKEDIKDEIRERFDVDPGDKTIEELKDLKEKLEEVEEKRFNILNKYGGVEESRLKGKNLDQLKQIEEELGRKDKLVNRLKAYGYENDELQKLSVEDLEKRISKIDRKKELLNKLDAELSDSEIREIPLKELKRLKAEKEERKELIEKLNNKGMDTDNLKDSSTEDLRKLSSEMNDESQNIDDTEKSVKEMEEQASDDLELLKGAKPESEDIEEQSKNEKNMRDKALSKVNTWKKEFSDVRSSNEDKKTEEEIRKEKLLDLLEDYNELDNNVEKSVKTAQVMKGFIEHSLSIRRELTYKEVSERIKDLGQEESDEGLIKISEFFSDIHGQIYSGNVYIENVDEIIKISKNIVRDF